VTVQVSASWLSSTAHLERPPSRYVYTTPERLQKTAPGLLMYDARCSIQGRDWDIFSEGVSVGGGSKAGRVEAGVGFSGEDSKALPQQIVIYGSAVSSQSEIRGVVSADVDLGTFSAQ